MNRIRIILIFLLFSCAQNIPSENSDAEKRIIDTTEESLPQDAAGAWRGDLDLKSLFSVEVSIVKSGDASWNATLISNRGVERILIEEENDLISFHGSEHPLHFNGRIPADGKEMVGFIAIETQCYKLVLPPIPNSLIQGWKDTFRLVEIESDSARIDLYIELGEDGSGGGYFFFRDQRLPSLYGSGFRHDASSISMAEINLGMHFDGHYLAEDDLLDLTVTALGGSLPIKFQRMPDEDVPENPSGSLLPAAMELGRETSINSPENIGDGWPVGRIADAGIDSSPLIEMVKDIIEDESSLTHSVLIAKNGTLVVEEYFYGFTSESMHDMRSASKSVASILVGLAIDQGRIVSAEDTIYQYLSRYRDVDNWDTRKASITIKDLLRMASGLDADDSDRNSVASEGAYQSQDAEPDWVKFALNAPMINSPGVQSLYGGANPLIIGGVLRGALDEPVIHFADRTLFSPLNILEYKFVADPAGTLYMAGGLHLRPRDMLKLGQLMLDGGTWQGKRILSNEWVAESTQKYGRLAPLDRNGHQYGYLWWHHQYLLGENVINSIEARGYGGQYIFILPEVDATVVITSGNYRNGKTRHPEELMQRYIIRALGKTVN